MLHMQLFEERQRRSPDPTRSIREWKLVRKLFRDEMLAAFIGSDSALAHPEFPFSWSINSRGVMEGVIDLLVIDEASRKCLVLDWKTNRIAAGDEQHLADRYRPQLAAYWKAVGEITAFSVTAGLYSTSTGKLLLYSTEELAAEWSRLAQLPDSELREQVAPDPL